MNQNLLDQLRPIILPADNISAWPLAIGWWIVLAFFVFGFIIFLFLQPKLKLHKQRKQLKKSTLQLLNTAYMACKEEKDNSLATQVYLQKSNDIFKRVIHTIPAHASASHLAGKEWVNFISAVDANSSFAQLYGDNLYALSCKEKIQLDELHSWATQWVMKVLQ